MEENRSTAALERRWSRTRCLCTALLFAVAATAPARAALAGPTAMERNLAEQLFIDGKKLMGEGRYEEACPKLAESHRLDPGGGTILNLAVCHEAQGRYATAWSEFREALDLARTDKRQDREEFALTELARIEPKLSRLTVVVERPNDTPGLVVTLDGEAVRPAAWGAPFPVDPGVHEIVASAPGRRDRRATIRIETPGDNKAVSIGVLELAPAPAVRIAPVEAAPAVSPSPPSTPAPVVATESPGSGARTAGFVIGGAGIVAIGAGAALGVWALDKNAESEKYCDGDACADQKGVELNEDARRLANLSNVGVGVGVAALLVGAYLVLTHDAPSGERISAQASTPRRKLAVATRMSPAGASVGLSGTW